MMKDTPTRVFGLMCVLVAVWTTVYWLYEPAEPPVTFDQTSGKEAGAEDARGPMAELSPPLSPPASVSNAREPAPPRSTSEPAKPRTGAEQQTTRVIPPEYWEYTVQSGDSMESIAKKLFGDGRLWTKVAEANPFVDARKLVPGRTRLRIPKDLGNIQGKEVTVQTPPPERSPARPSPEPAKPSPSSPAPTPASTTYVVKSGDTLSGIAKEVYGKAGLWHRIYEANKSVIDDPDHVKPGVTLKIPPKD